MKNFISPGFSVILFLCFMGFYTQIYAGADISNRALPEKSVTGNKETSVSVRQQKIEAKQAKDEFDTFSLGQSKPSAGKQSAGQVSISDSLIGATFKGLAKAFVATADIEKLKKANIEKLEKKDEARFRKQYLKIYDVAKDCPALSKRYGLNEDLSKEQAIDEIKAIKKEDMYAALDLMPDSVIANQFRIYLKGQKQKMEKSNLVKQIEQLWNKMTSRAFSDIRKKRK